MNISSEKAELLERVEKVNDLALIRAIRNLLDFGLSRQEENDAMEVAIEKGLMQSEAGDTHLHEEVMSEFRKKISL